MLNNWFNIKFIHWKGLNEHLSPKRRGTKQQSDPSGRAHINKIRTCVRLTILQHDSNTDQSPGSLSSNSTIPKREIIQQQHTTWIPTDSVSTYEIRLIKMSTIRNSSSSSFTEFLRQHKLPYLVCLSNQTILFSLVVGTAESSATQPSSPWTQTFNAKDMVSFTLLWCLQLYLFISTTKWNVKTTLSNIDSLFTSNASATLFYPFYPLNLVLSRPRSSSLPKNHFTVPSFFLHNLTS